MTTNPKNAEDLKREAEESLKHRPIYLLPYLAHDGPYAGDSDCKFLSLGWAQYDPRSASVKVLRHTGDRWSRQSEELPLHRAIDAVILLASAINSIVDGHLGPIHFPSATFENQLDDVLLQTVSGTSDAFVREITSPLVLQRLVRLRDILNAMNTDQSNAPMSQFN
jgi:hypothetical protein